MRPTKILIAVPMLKTVVAEFTTSLIGVLSNAGGIPCIYSPVVETLVWNARNKLMLKALETGCDYIMWFDSDMVFAPDTLTRMLKFIDDGHDMVTGVY